MINYKNNKLRVLTIGIISSISLMLSQSYEEIANRMTIENYFTEQITDAIQTTVLDKNQFVVKVKVGISNTSPATSQKYNIQPKKQSSPQVNNVAPSGSVNSLRWITGTGTQQPAVSPKQDPQQTQNLDNTQAVVPIGNIISFSAIVYLDESIASGETKESIKQIVTDYVPQQFSNCADCVEIKTMKFKNDGESEELTSLKEELENLRLSLEAERGKVDREKENIINERIEALEEMLDDKQYQLEEFLDIERARIEAQARKDSIETAELRTFKEQSIADTKKQLEKAEKDKDDITDYHIRTNDSIIFKMIEKSPSSDSEEEGKEEGNSERNMYIILGAIIFLFLVILIVILNSGKKQPVQTVYLKPKGSGSDGGKGNKDGKNGKNKKSKKKDSNQKSNDDDSNNESGESAQPQPPAPAQQAIVQPTMAHQDDNVIRSEMQSMRQSAVSMSVGQKEGASQLIKDWLSDGAPADGGGEESEEAEE